MLGRIATAIAVLAVAALGFAMLTERIDHRRAFTVLVGCFLVFGASGIAASFLSSNVREPISERPQIVAAVPPPSPALGKPQQPRAPYDPYAGASVPQ